MSLGILNHRGVSRPYLPLPPGEGGGEGTLEQRVAPLRKSGYSGSLPASPSASGLPSSALGLPSSVAPVVSPGGSSVATGAGPVPSPVAPSPAGFSGSASIFAIA